MKLIRIILLLLRFQPIFERATSLAPSDLAPQERQQEAHRYIDWARKAAPEIACFGNRRADLWAEWSECSLEDVTPDEQCPHARNHFAEGGMSQNPSKWSQTPQLSIAHNAHHVPCLWGSTKAWASGIEDRPNAVDYGWTQLDSIWRCTSLCLGSHASWNGETWLVENWCPKHPTWCQTIKT